MPIVEEENKKKLSILIPKFQDPSQVDNFRVYSNPLSSEDVKENILNNEQFDYFKPSSSLYTPLTSIIPIIQIKVSLPAYSHIQLSTLQVQVPSSQASPNMATQPPNMMYVIVFARYAPLVLPQPINPLPNGYFQKYLPRLDGQGEATV